MSIRTTSADEPEEEHTGRELGLLKLAGNQKFAIHCLSGEVDYLQTHVLLPGLKCGAISQRAVWDYVNKYKLWVSCSSEHYNVKSTVNWYENKKGERFMAHYTQHGKYLQRVRKGEEDGIWYTGKFPITEQTHTIVINESATKLEQMFKLL
jgi:hypothetical protein